MWTTQRLTYPAQDGPVRAYLARPTQGGPWPALIVVHDRYGLWEHIEDSARRFAEEGYLALAPDLYSRDPVRAELQIDDVMAGSGILNAEDLASAVTAFPPERRDAIRRAVDWLKGRDSSTHLPDLQAALSYIRSRTDIGQEAVGVMGYCMGGARAAELAVSGADLAAAVIWYGTFPSFDLVPRIRCPVQGHYGALDRITAQVPELEAAMKASGKDFTAYIYEDAPHAFANDHAAGYRPEATRLAWARTREFLERHLKRSPVVAG